MWLAPAGPLKASHWHPLCSFQPRPLVVPSIDSLFRFQSLHIQMCSQDMCVPTGARHRISQKSQSGGGYPGHMPPELLPLPFLIYPLRGATFLRCLAASGTSLRSLDHPRVTLKFVNSKSHCVWSFPRNLWLCLTHPGFPRPALWTFVFLTESSLCFPGKPHRLAFMTEVPGEESD